MATVWFLSVSHPYDDSRILEKECRALADEGHNVTHAAPDWSGSTPESVDEISIVTFPPGRRLTGRMLRCWHLLRLTANSRPDIVHCNEMESWAVGVLLKLAGRTKRVVFDVHEHYPSRFDEPHSPRILRGWGRYLVLAAIRILSPFTDFFVFAKRSVASDYPAPRERSAFIFNYAPVRLAPPLDDSRHRFPEPTAIHIGGLSRARGWPVLIEALALMQDKSLRVLALGEVQEGVDTLLAYADKFKVRERIDVRSRIPYKEIFPLLAASRVGLMLYQPGTANHVYAFPMKLYDYMLAGIPVIGPDFAIEVEPVISECECGWLIDTSSPRALATALDEAASQPERSTQMGQRGREAATTRYAWEPQAQRLRSLYAKLAAEI